MTALDPQANLRRSVYCLLIALSVATMSGHIMAVRSRPGGTPMLSANDRSRWCTVRSLVDLGTYQIDDVIVREDGQRDKEWHTIDMVRHRGADGREHSYSSKPPLLATMVAAKYWLLKHSVGATLSERPFYVVRFLLLTTNVLPLLLYFVLLAILIERLGATDWGRMFVMATATFGTFLTSFAVTLNNHLPAAVAILVAAYATLRVLRDGRRELRYLAVAGGCAAFAAANELPALSLFTLLAGVLTWQLPRQTLLGFVPAAALVAAAFFATNYAAHRSWRPPYAHRSEGAVLAVLPADIVIPPDLPDAATLSPELRKNFPAQLSPSATLSRGTAASTWVVWDPDQQQRWVVRPRSNTASLEVCSWDNWYQYDNSYWTAERRRGVDRGEASRVIYAFHMTLGHRGILSLTPVWLLSVFGIGLWIQRSDQALRGAALVISAATLVCLAFYVCRPLVDRNYGGVAAGFRWMFWFVPLWLLTTIPAADAIASRRSWRAIAYVLLAVSVFSASYPALNPWSHSWIFDYWSDLGWIRY